MKTLTQLLKKPHSLSLTFILLLVLSACAAPAISTPSLPAIEPSTPQPLAGVWMGTAQKPDGETLSIIINFDESTLQIEPFIKTWEISASQADSMIHFFIGGKVQDPFKTMEFTGSFSAPLQLSGDIIFDGKSSLTMFLPIKSLAKEKYERYEGVYKFGSGRALSIILSPEFTSGGLQFFSNTLMMTDFESGALRSLYPLDEQTFLVGVKRDIGAPFDGKIQFQKDAQGRVTGLMWWRDAYDPGNSEPATRIDYSVEDHIEFTSQDGKKLVGRLSLPISDLPVPAIMQLHGSEPGTRDNFGAKAMAHFMISQGFAILNYDKRGVGDSQGVYQEAASTVNLQRHASDAIAGVEYLKSRVEIDPIHIGLIGGSQAGWVIPLAASQSDAIKFFVIISGPVASTSQEDVFSSYTNDGESDTAYDDAKITQRLREMSPGGFDPIPVLQELEQPGLWLWGSVDKNQPVTFDAENLQALIDTGKDNFSYIIFPNGDHNLNETPHGLFAEMPFSPRVLFYSMLAEWLKKNTSKGK